MNDIKKTHTFKVSLSLFIRFDFLDCICRICQFWGENLHYYAICYVWWTYEFWTI